MDNLHIALFIWQFIFFILCTVVIIITSRSFITKKNTNEYKRPLAILSFIGMISFWLTALIGGILKTYYGATEVFGDSYDICNVLSGFIWVIAQTCIYFLFIHRIKYSFENTVYQSSKTVYILFYIGIISFAIVAFGKYFYLYLWRFGFGNPYFISGPKFTEGLAVFNVTMCLVDFILSVCFIYLFINKLMLVALGSVQDVNKWNQVQNRNMLSSLLNVMVKYMLLSVYAILLSEILMLYWAIKDLHNAISNNEDAYLVTTLSGNIIWPIEVFTNCLCIALYLPGTEGLYNKICHGCHSFCKLWFTKIAEKKIARKTELQQSLLDSNGGDQSL